MQVTPDSFVWTVVPNSWQEQRHRLDHFYGVSTEASSCRSDDGRVHGHCRDRECANNPKVLVDLNGKNGHDCDRNLGHSSHLDHNHGGTLRCLAHPSSILACPSCPTYRRDRHEIPVRRSFRLADRIGRRGPRDVGRRDHEDGDVRCLQRAPEEGRTSRVTAPDTSPTTRLVRGI